MLHSRTSFGSLLLALCLLASSPAFSQKHKKKGKKDKTTVAATTAAKSDTKKPKKLGEFTKDFTKQEGLFTLYQDTTDGTVYMLVDDEQLGKEYIYFTHTVDGVLAAGHFRGSFRENNVFRAKKYFNRIELETVNNDFYFDKSQPLSRSADANISHSVVVSEDIVAIDSATNSYLIKADDIFLSENMHQIKPSPRPGAKPGKPAFSSGKS